MIRRNFMLLSCVLLWASAALADNEALVTLNGGEAKSGLTSITFNGDEATMLFADNTQLSASMENFEVNFTYDTTPTAIVAVGEATTATAPTKVFALDGRYIGATTQGLAKGVYIVNGKKTVVK
jgi:hypothetical protein